MHEHGQDWKMREMWLNYSEEIFDSFFFYIKKYWQKKNNLKYLKFWRGHFVAATFFNTLQNDLHFYIWLFATGSVMLPLVYIGSVNVVGHAVFIW